MSKNVLEHIVKFLSRKTIHVTQADVSSRIRLHKLDDTHAPRDLSSPYNIVIGVAAVNRNPLIVDSHTGI